MPEDCEILRTVADGLDALGVRYGMDPEANATPQELRRIADRIKEKDCVISNLSRQVRIYDRLVKMMGGACT